MLLSGRFVPYAEPEVQQQLEASLSHLRSGGSARIRVRGQSYEVSVRASQPRQQAVGGGSRSRAVRRRELGAAGAAGAE